MQDGASAPRNARFIGQQLSAELVRAARPIVARKNPIGYLLAPWILCAGVEKFPPARMDGQSRKRIRRSNPNRRPGTIARRPILVGTQGKPLRAFIGWSGSIPGRCQEGISTIEIEFHLGALKRSFLYGNQSPRCRDSSGQPGTRTAPSPHDRRRKSFPHKSEIPPRHPYLQHTFFEHHITNPKQNGLHCLLLHRLRRGPQGDQDPGAHLPSVTRFPAVRSGRR